MNEFPDISHSISIPYQLKVFFTEDVFDGENPLFRNLVCSRENGNRRKVLFYIDKAVSTALPDLAKTIGAYFERFDDDLRFKGIHLLPGGESAKNDTEILKQIYSNIEKEKLCRHSYIVAIGGGALLDTVGFAAATAHRGIRHIRIPTTTLAQGDAGVGVKNGFNYHKKKNFVGTFAPPYAVINDFRFLETLPDRQLRNGYIEGVKVALIRDRPYFDWICANVEALARFDHGAIRTLIHRSADLHVTHIATSGDPFEIGSVRPLDFGHWAAHKLEQLSDFRINHGEAVAIGIAIDTLYSRNMGYIDAPSAETILSLIRSLGFDLYCPELEQIGGSGDLAVLEGLEEFREHLGGVLTITLLKQIGERFEVHEMNTEKIAQSVADLKSYSG